MILSDPCVCSTLATVLTVVVSLGAFLFQVVGHILSQYLADILVIIFAFLGAGEQSIIAHLSVFVQCLKSSFPLAFPLSIDAFHCQGLNSSLAY